MKRPLKVQRCTLYRFLFELIVKNRHTPTLKSAIIRIINGDALSSAKKSVVMSVQAVYE